MLVYGSDEYDGGEGIDTIDYSGLELNGEGIEADLTKLQVIKNNGQDRTKIDYLENIENVIGTDNNDTFIGNDLSNILKGGGGEDTADYSSDDSITIHYWQDSSVTVTDGSGATDALYDIETIIGSKDGNNDTIDYSDLSDGKTISLLGNNTNIENIIGSKGDDQLTGGNNKNVLKGGIGDDQFWVTGGDDELYGGEGNDTFYLSGDSVTIDGGVGEDTLDLSEISNNSEVDLNSYTNVENIDGNDADNTLTGNALDNILLGKGGNDRLIGGAGDDTLNGGDGDDDTADYSDQGAGIIVTLVSGGADVTDEWGSTDTLVGIENIIGSKGNDTFFY